MAENLSNVIVIRDKEAFLKVWRKIPLVDPTVWAGSMAENAIRWNPSMEYSRFKEKRKEAENAAYEEYVAMTPDEWMAVKIEFLRTELRTSCR